MEKENKLSVVFLLDRSGSMYDCVTDTIGGYNSYIKSLKKDRMDVSITTVLFDHEIETLYDKKSIKDVPLLTDKEYYVNGSTALLDAIGYSIKKIDKAKLKNKILFIITTDGYENSSIHYTKEQIKEMIEGHKNIEFIYIGADIDSFKESSSLGIKEKNTANYAKNKKGIKALYESIGKASYEMCEEYEEELSDSWKKPLEDYLGDNQL